MFSKPWCFQSLGTLKPLIILNFYYYYEIKDMECTNISERNQVANRLAAFIFESGLTNPYGGDVEQDKRSKGKPYNVAFSRPGDLDGQLSIYSPKFIRFKFLARSQGQQSFVVESEENAIEVIKAIAQYDWGTLKKIPRKAPGARTSIAEQI